MIEGNYWIWKGIPESWSEFFREVAVLYIATALAFALGILSAMGIIMELYSWVA